MGFKLMSDDPVVPAERDEHAMGDVDIAPEDVVGLDIGGELEVQGADIPQHGRLVVVPNPTDKFFLMVLNSVLTAVFNLFGLHATAKA